MRTWTLAQIDPGVSVRAFDAREASERLLVELGLEPVPCCHLEDEPCVQCRAEAERAEQDRLEQMGKAQRVEPYQPSDDLPAGVVRAMFPPEMMPPEP